jgi:hypothetical protein
MKPSWLFRTAAVLQLFFALTHTVGLLSDEKHSAAIDGALQTLKRQSFPIMGTPRTFWQLYIGFGLLFTVFMVTASVLTWQLASASAGGRAQPEWRRMAWVLFAGQLGTTALCWTHFFIAPQLVSTVATMLLALGAQRMVVRSTTDSLST